MLGRSKSSQRGDTIIEVLFAVVVFSVVAVGAMTLMNRGTSTAQRALELTLVRHQIDAQAEALRFIHNSYIVAYGTSAVNSGPASEWLRIKNPANQLTKVSASSFGDDGCGAIPSRAFVMNARTGRVHTGEILKMSTSSRPFSQVLYQDAIEFNDATSDVSQMGTAIDSVHGLWIEAVPSKPATPATPNYGTGYIDFHIRACWYSPATSAPSTIGTIVRLYEPL